MLFTADAEGAEKIFWGLERKGENWWRMAGGARKSFHGSQFKKGFLGALCVSAVNTPLCLNQSMFARKVRVEYEHDGQLQPCPLKWLDNFSMRNFTNASVFDDTLPVADGRLEIGTNVPLDQLQDAMEDWFRRKSYLPKDATLVLTLS